MGIRLLATLGTLLMVSNVSLAEEKKNTSEPHEYVIAAFQSCWEAGDLEMAETIATGAKEKFGEYQAFVLAMQRAVRAGKAATERGDMLPPFEHFKLAWSHPYATVYTVATLLEEKPGNQHSTYDAIIARLKSETDEKLWENEVIAVAVYRPKQALVVSAPQAVHDQFKEILLDLRASRK